MKMNYFVVGTNDRDAAAKFYDALFEGTGFAQAMATDRMTYWMSERAAFAVATPFDEEPATKGNGMMVGFDAGSNDEVERLHQKAIDLGGTCEGAPNLRGPYFSAYVRDLDQNKICFGTLVAAA